MLRHEFILLPDSARVILRPFIPSNAQRGAEIIGRALALCEAQVEIVVQDLRDSFEARHFDIELLWLKHYAMVQTQVLALVSTHHPLSFVRQLLIGALFSGEYALESAALFNPSIVAHPDQSGIPEGALRFIMSLRATGEGHISSIEFRVGTILPDGSISFDPVSRYVSLPEVLPNPTYLKRSFVIKLLEMGFNDEVAEAVLGPLAAEFTLIELSTSVAHVRQERNPINHEGLRTLECVQWLADSNYEISFSPRLALSERIIFPVSVNESHGIEDARFVRFVEEDGSVIYYATYTAYNGSHILPMLLETLDFLHFRVLTLNGSAVQNKGMALFPRRINGQYVMLSRQDDVNLFIMYSDNARHWNDPEILLTPTYIWESVKIGNCGSPIETPAGWLVITHGVGPMRTYCIGAALLDLNDPSKVIGRLSKPLLVPEGHEREGYVPNVVYSCGSLLHGNRLILPYAMSDTATGVVSINLDELLAALQASE